MDGRMFSGQAGLNYSFNLSDDRELVDAPAGRGKLSPTGFVVLSVVLGFIMTFGFLNNFIVLLLFCKFKKLRTPVNMLLLNISVSDMLVCVFGTTLSFASSIRGRWLLGRSGCSWYGFINSCFGKSVLFPDTSRMPEQKLCLGWYVCETPHKHIFLSFWYVIACLIFFFQFSGY